jgi:hypothetical protein
MTKSMKELYDNGEIATALEAGDLFLVTRDPAGTPVSKVITRETLQSILDWIADENTWTYSSADDPTFVISVDADMTGLIGVGNRIELVQSGSTKYFIVTAVGTYSGGATLITVFGGTDFDLANETISSPKYSRVKAPFGFPMDKTKWRVTLTDETYAVQNSPTASVWYNLGSLSIDIPIGSWRVYWEAGLEIQDTLASAGGRGFRATMSTTSSTESDDDLTGTYTFSMPAITNGTSRATLHREKMLNLSSKTTYYLNANVGVATLNVSFRGDVLTTTVVAECAYL